MAEAAQSMAWRYWVLFAGLALLSLFWRMLPLPGAASKTWVGPDLLVCLVLAWVLRRPDFVPALLIAAAVLVEDLLLMRPPGLWALVVLGGAEFLRARQPLMRELPFMLEWVMVGAVMTAMWLVERLVLGVLMVPMPGLAASLMQLAATLAAYPLVVLVSRHLMRVRKPATGEVDALGRRL